MGKAASAQFAFRSRDDDVGLNSATWTRAQDTDWTQDTGVNFRVRIGVEETGGGTFNCDAQLEYYHAEGTATWTAVNGSSSVVRSSASGQYTDGDTIGSGNDQLTGSSQTFNNSGEGESSDGLCATDTLSNQFSEYEYCVQLRAADVSDGDTVYLRVTDAGVALDSYGAGTDPALANNPVITVNLIVETTEFWPSRRAILGLN